MRPLRTWSPRRALEAAAIVTMGLMNQGCEDWNDDARTAVGALLVSDTALVRQLFDLSYTPEGTDNSGLALYADDPRITEFTMGPADNELTRWATVGVRVTAGPGLIQPGVAPPAAHTVDARLRVLVTRSAERRWMFFVPETRRRMTAGPWQMLERHAVP